MRAVFLFDLYHEEGFLSKLDPNRNIDVVFALNNTRSVCSDRKVVLGLHDIIKFIPKVSVVVFFDIAPIICVLLINHLNAFAIRVVFVQHGHITVANKQRIRSKLSKFYFYLKLFYGSLASFSNKLRTIKLFSDYLIRGGYASLNNVQTHLHIDNALFMREYDANIIRAFSNVKIKSSVIGGGIDSVCQNYNSKGSVVYLSQPLHLDNILTKADYIKYVLNLCKKFDNIIIVRHPRIEKDFFTQLEIPTFDNSDVRDMPVSLVIGHFSTLLLYDFGQIPLYFDNLENAMVKERVNTILDERKNFGMILSDNLQRKLEDILYES